MSASVGNTLTGPQQPVAPTPAPPAGGPARPMQNTLTRFGATAQPMQAGPRLPAYALRVPNPLAPQPTAPAVVQPSPHPPEAPRSDYGLEHQVSTRIPTVGEDQDPHSHPGLKIDLASLRPDLSDESKAGRLKTDYYNKLVNKMRLMYPHVNTTNMSNDDAMEALVGHMHDNIVGMWNQIRDRPWLQEAVHWYWGANKYAHDLAQEYTKDNPNGISHRQAAAAIAALSPQTDWNQNVNRVERMMNIIRNHKETEFNPDMHKFVFDQMMARTGQKARDRGLAELAQLPIGTKFKDIRDPRLQAFFARAHDELYNPDKSYPIISPSGERFAQAPLEGTGAPPKMAWGNFSDLHNAFKALQSDDLKNISESLGMKHKVRNFYNNIIAPDSDQGHVTADTHAINVGQMMPMGSSHTYVEHGLGNGLPHTAYLGGHGLYAAYADAYRRAAATISRLEGRRYLPREVQSATWEGVKGLFDNPAHKGLQLPFIDARGRPTGDVKKRVSNNPEAGEPSHHVGKVAQHFWNFSRHGVIRPSEARQAVINAAGGIADPDWWQRRQAQQAQPRSV